MLVRFIAHAGIAIEEAGVTVIIDPWFRDSTQDHPLIESIGGGHASIDFQIPKTPLQIEDFAPDAILVSHFHAHHSVARDIIALCENAAAKKKRALFAYPTPDEKTEAVLTERLPSPITKIPVRPQDSFSVGPFTIEARGHTVSGHITWYVRSNTGSIIHIGDGRLNRYETVRTLDAVWEYLRGLSPSIVFLSSGGHSLRTRAKDGTPQILEGGIFSPVEAAKVAHAIHPRAVAPIGFFNHSIWKNRVEYILPASLTQEEFAWAISWLAPDIKHLQLTPGMTIGIGEHKDACDVYLES